MKRTLVSLGLCVLVASACGDGEDTEEGADNTGGDGGGGGSGGAGGSVSAGCGDNVTSQDEVCDDGNTLDGDGCSADCASDESCGNNVQDVGEACDDGNTLHGDGCSADCTSDESCGNDVLDMDEACDDGNAVGGDGCSADCESQEACGNNVLDEGEACDDGNFNSGDGCSYDCSSDALCGNDVVELGEYCDDGMTAGGCSDYCHNPTVVGAASAGKSHTCARLEDGSVKCWGGGYEGQLGYGDIEARGDDAGEMADVLATVDLGAGRIVVEIATSNLHNCARFDDDSVKCWGWNANGILGLGDTEDRGDDPNEMGDNLPTVDLGTNRTAVAITAGGGHNCAILDDGSVKCWGGNFFGELGLGDITDRGDDPNEMGDNLPTVDLGTNRTAVAISSSYIHTCAILNDGAVKCWGMNTEGQLGYGDTTRRGDDPGEMGDNLPTVALGAGRSAIAISAGEWHTCALLDNMTVKCWGSNDYGELGLGHTMSQGSAADQMGDDLPAVALGSGRTAVAVVAGAGFSCAVLDDSSLKCWGRNFEGQLGLGPLNQTGGGASDMGDNLPVVDLGSGRTVMSITTGTDHACTVLDDMSVKCWGSNTLGRLGLGDTSARGDEPDEMGDDLPTIGL